MIVTVAILTNLINLLHTCFRLNEWQHNFYLLVYDFLHSYDWLFTPDADISNVYLYYMLVQSSIPYVCGLFHWFVMHQVPPYCGSED